MNGLHFLRLQCDTPVEWLAKKFQVDPGTIESWENNSQDIPDDKKTELAQLFGVNESDLVAINDNRKAELIRTPMFICIDNGEKYYSYQIPKDFKDGEIVILFRKEQNELLMNDPNEYEKNIANAINEIETTLRSLGAEKRTKGEQSMNVGCGCYLYSLLTENYKKIQSIDHPGLKIPMLLALDGTQVAFKEAFESAGGSSIDETNNDLTAKQINSNIEHALNELDNDMKKCLLKFMRSIKANGNMGYRKNVFNSLEEALAYGKERFGKMKKNNGLTEYNYTAFIKKR